MGIALSQFINDRMNRIVTGDSRELAKMIPDNSVDLIFTDPPYPHEYVHLYGWLAEEAARVLKPGALCVAMSGQAHLPEIYALMSPHLTYHWTFGMFTPEQSCTVWNRRLSTAWKPLLSWVKGRYEGPMFGRDVIPSSRRDKDHHFWGQSESSAATFISKLQPAFVWEPFVGGGTTNVVCKRLGVACLGFEVDPDVAARARARLAATPAALIGLDVEQAEMAL